MTNKEIQQKRLTLLKERKELQLKLKKAEEELKTLQQECPHKIVLGFDDRIMRKVGPITHCICPTCNKKEDVFAGHGIEKTAFSNSKIIDLTDKPAHELSEQSSIILKQIMDNYEYFVSEETSAEEIKHSIYLELEANKLNKKI